MKANKPEKNMIYDLRFKDNLMIYRLKSPFRLLSRIMGLQTSLVASSEGVTDFVFRHLGAGFCLLYFSFQQKDQTASGKVSTESKPLLLLLKKGDRRVWEKSMVVRKESKNSITEVEPPESKLIKLNRYSRIEGMYIYDYHG